MKNAEKGLKRPISADFREGRRETPLTPICYTPICGSPNKGPTKPKNRTNSAKEFSEQFEGLTGHCPLNKGFEANHTRKFTRTFGKIFVTQFLCDTFSVPKDGPHHFLPYFFSPFPPISFSGQVRPRQGTEICSFGAPSPLEALHWIFCFFSSIYVQFSKTSPPKSGESSERSSGENFWRVPNPPGANPLVAERAPREVFAVLCDRGSAAYWKSLQRFLSFLLHTRQPLCDPNSHSWGRLFPLPGG